MTWQFSVWPVSPVVLWCDTDALVALLDRLGVIGDHRGIDRSQTRHHRAAHLVPQDVGVACRAVEQVLERAGRGQPGVLGQPPGVLLRHVGQKRPHHQPERHLRLGAVEYPAQALGEGLEISVPAGDVLSSHDLDHDTGYAWSAGPVQDLGM
jgi:hypothetical protein